MKNAKIFEKFKKEIEDCWDQTTIYPGLFFDITRPAIGQCEPTVCLVQDFFGGDIYKISDDESILPKKTHYYNYIDGEFIDLTSAQFYRPVPYEKGIKLTEKDANMLRRTSYCNRKVRYQCLKNNFENIDKLILQKEKSALYNVGIFFEDVGKVLMDSPWEEIMNWFPELFKLITFVMDCGYDRREGLGSSDIMSIIEHYLQGYYQDDSEQIIKQWRDKIVKKNGLKFQS